MYLGIDAPLTLLEEAAPLVITRVLAQTVRGSEHDASAVAEAARDARCGRPPLELSAPRPAQLLSLQRTAGNAAVGRMLGAHHRRQDASTRPIRPLTSGGAPDTATVLAAAVLDRKPSLAVPRAREFSGCLPTGRTWEDDVRGTRRVQRRPVAGSALIQRAPSCRRLLPPGEDPRRSAGRPRARESAVQEFLAEALESVGTVERELPIPAGSAAPWRTDSGHDEDDTILDPQTIAEGTRGSADIAMMVDNPALELVDPSGSLSGYVKEAGGARRSDGRVPDQSLRDRAQR